jgi:2OG-Fe(II) oxygenase superfamily
MTTDASLGDTQSTILDLDALEAAIDDLHAEYMAASSYPHLVFDDFLDPAVVAKAIDEFPPLDPAQWNNYLHANERKFSNTDPVTWGPTLQEILAVLNSPRFVAFVGKLIGVENLLPDPTLEGGGLHQSTTGGFLNVHADFTVHPHNRKLQRRANILLYLNPDWQAEYGGDLEIWSRDMSQCVEKVSPIANRVLIFSTEQDSFHGHPDPMTCPEGMARRSMALYYFSLEDDPVIRSTEYRARPDDGGLHAVSIWTDKQMLRVYDWAKRHLGLSDELAQKVLATTDRLRRKSPPGT